MGLFSNKTHNQLNNQKGYSQKDKNRVNQLSRKAGQAQKVVDTQGKTSDKNGKGKR